ncbi:hypothetical protein GCM10020220_001800 [Nonomuraea rubra]
MDFFFAVVYGVPLWSHASLGRMRRTRSLPVSGAEGGVSKTGPGGANREKDLDTQKECAELTVVCIIIDEMQWKGKNNRRVSRVAATERRKNAAQAGGRPTQRC